MMPYYKVHGRGIDTGKRRTHGPWYSLTKWEIEEKAGIKHPDTEILSIEECPHDPPSDPQLRLCKHKGIEVLPTHTKYDVSYLISCEIEALASSNQTMVLATTGYKLDKYEPPTEARVVYLIDRYFGDKRIDKRARWFVYSVIRYLTRGVWTRPAQSGIPDTLVRQIVAELISDDRYKKQFEADEWDDGLACKCGHPAYDLDHHRASQFKRIAYVRARELVTKKLQLTNARGRNIGNVAPDLRGFARAALEKRQLKECPSLESGAWVERPNAAKEHSDAWKKDFFWIALVLAVSITAVVTVLIAEIFGK